MAKLGLLTYLGLVHVIGKSSEGAEHRAYVCLHDYLNPDHVK